MRLFGYWRSTTTFRVRAALNLKGAAYTLEAVDLRAGQQFSQDYLKLNPSKSVPVLALDDGIVLSQSLAIMEYLDAIYPTPQLLPTDPLTRAKVLSAAQIVASDIHPVNNLRILGQLKKRFGATQDQVEDWMRHWMREGFTSLEAVLPDSAGFAFGDAPDLADLCIVAQAYNAHRWRLSLADFPKIARIEAACLAVPEINAAHPDNQPKAKVKT